MTSNSTMLPLFRDVKEEEEDASLQPKVSEYIGFRTCFVCGQLTNLRRNWPRGECRQDSYLNCLEQEGYTREEVQEKLDTYYSRNCCSPALCYSHVEGFLASLPLGNEMEAHPAPHNPIHPKPPTPKKSSSPVCFICHSATSSYYRWPRHVSPNAAKYLENCGLDVPKVLEMKRRFERSGSQQEIVFCRSHMVVASTAPSSIKTKNALHAMMCQVDSELKPVKEEVCLEDDAEPNPAAAVKAISPDSSSGSKLRQGTMADVSGPEAKKIKEEICEEDDCVAIEERTTSPNVSSVPKFKKIKQDRLDELRLKTTFVPPAKRLPLASIKRARLRSSAGDHEQQSPSPPPLDAAPAAGPSTLNDQKERLMSTLLDDRSSLLMFSTPLGRVAVRCNICFITCTGQAFFLEHMRLRHPEVDGTTFSAAIAREQAERAAARPPPTRTPRTGPAVLPHSDRTKQHMCVRCGLVLKTPLLLASHLRTCANPSAMRTKCQHLALPNVGARVYSATHRSYCPICRRFFPTQHDYAHHAHDFASLAYREYVTTVWVRGQAVQRCRLCERNFATLQVFQEHFLGTHRTIELAYRQLRDAGRSPAPREMIPLGGNVLCTCCGKWFPQKMQNTHQCRRRLTEDGEEVEEGIGNPQPSPPPVPPIDRTSEIYFFCLRCTDIFTTKALVLSHRMYPCVLRGPDTGDVDCPICDETYKSPYEWRTHIKHAHPGDFRWAALYFTPDDLRSMEVGPREAPKKSRVRWIKEPKTERSIEPGDDIRVVKEVKREVEEA